MNKNRTVLLSEKFDFTWWRSHGSRLQICLEQNTNDIKKKNSWQFQDFCKEVMGNLKVHSHQKTTLRWWVKWICNPFFPSQWLSKRSKVSLVIVTVMVTEPFGVWTNLLWTFFEIDFEIDVLNLRKNKHVWWNWDLLSLWSNGEDKLYSFWRYGAIF